MYKLANISSIAISLKLMTLVIIMFICNNTEAQDIHYTQFTLQALQQTPAFAGDFDGNHRFAALYRNQWATVAVPYNTFGFSYDTKAYETKKYNSFLGLGGNLFYDQAGDSRLRSLYAQIPISYTLFLPAGKGNTFKVGAGLYLGMLNKSINTSQLQFDNQYSGDIFDPTIPIAENFGNLGFTKMDLGIGYQIGFNLQDKHEIGLGFGVHHLNKIEESFLDAGVGIQLQKRLAMPIYLKFQLAEKWDLRLDYLYQEQNSLTAFNFGAIASYFLKKDGPAKTAIEFGTYYRWKDALSGIVRYRKNNLLVGFSYDVNLSPLKAATNSYGGVEWGLVYTIKKVKDPQIKNKRKCIVF